MPQTKVEVVATTVHTTSPTRETAPEVQKLIAEGRREEALNLMASGGKQVQVRASGDGADVQFLVRLDEAPKIGDSFELTLTKIPALKPAKIE